MTICFSGIGGRLDDFVEFLYQTGILGLFDDIDSHMERKPEIPRRFLHYCISLKPVVDSASINQLPGRLFEDTDTLRISGFTIVELKNGFSVKNKNGNNVPVNKNAFYDELVRLPERESKKFFTSEVEMMGSKRFLSKRSEVYALLHKEIQRLKLARLQSLFSKLAQRFVL